MSSAEEKIFTLYFSVTVGVKINEINIRNCGKC